MSIFEKNIYAYQVSGSVCTGARGCMYESFCSIITYGEVCMMVVKTVYYRSLERGRRKIGYVDSV